MSAEPESLAWTDLEEALRLIRGVAYTLKGLSDDIDGAAQYLGQAVQYLGDRLDDHCDDARDAFNRLHDARHKKAEP